MPNFTALNIIPDDHSDDEVDNTRELQIEEALKLYQVALKLHSQGPESFQYALEAYETLFRSEIFRYPESITEFERIDKNPELEQVDVSFPLELDLGAVGEDGAPSTLPQVLYLAFKNHGQFILDCVKARLRLPDSEVALDKPNFEYQAVAALKNFVLALSRDESDTELWRRAARIASLLGSRRIVRYCLEAAVEVDDDPTVAEVDPMSLEEGFSGEQLKEQLEVLDDSTALSHPIMGPFNKRKMASFLTKHMDPYPFLPDNTKELGPGTERPLIKQERLVIDVGQWSWSALGTILRDTYLQQGHLGFPTTGILIRFPEGEPIAPHEHEPLPGSDENQIMEDAGVIESPMAETVDATPIPTREASQPMENATTVTVPLVDERPASPTQNGLPTRKRSQSAAGIRDTPEDDSGAQKRSKRIRNRDNTMEINPVAQFAEQLKPLADADTKVFEFVGDLLGSIGVNDLGSFEDLQTAMSRETTDREDAIVNTAVKDLRDILKTWDSLKSSTFANASAEHILGSAAGGANAGLAAFLEHSKVGPLKVNNKPTFAISEGLEKFALLVENDWMPTQDVIFMWLRTILDTYLTSVWPDDLKSCVMQTVSYLDPDIYGRVKTDVERLQAHGGDPEELTKLENMVQTLFELHLDLFTMITNPSSIVSHDMRTISKDRLDRWAEFATDLVRIRQPETSEDISLRYLWASVFYATKSDNISREHQVLCWADLQNILREADKPIIELQNNAVMQEISASAAEREVSRLTTKEFFYSLFQTDTSNPIAIIETLEPVLDPDSAYEATAPEGDEADVDQANGTPAALRDMWKFLRSGSTSLRLFLWQRLREAYSTIGYSTKVFSCYLKSIEIIVADLRTDTYVDSPDETRQQQLLLWLKALDDLLVKALTQALNDSASCFEIIDERHLKSTCGAIAQLNRVLHSAAIFDDEIRIGMTQLPVDPEYGPQGTFQAFIVKLREMQVRTWALQYTMIKEAMAQNHELYPTPDKDLADFLAVVHYSLGLRKCCKVSNKIFLKMMKVEMIRLKQVDNWEDYLGQVLYDLYGLRLGVGTYMLDEHGCPPEALDRRTVLNIAEQIIILANRMSMKDLNKHELRSTLERMQTAIGATKSTPQLQHNLRNLTEYLKTSIRPIRLLQALKGQVEIDSLPITTQDSLLAHKGWYFLQGMIALTKFRAQKRVGPGGQTDDLRVAATFMRLQLQHTTDNWEAWYRLAQCFDAELEDEVMWTADKINNHRSDLIRIQRGSIHCYTMAVSTALRSADDSFETATKISEMYHDFGMRIYASSREPFTCEAFWVDEFEKHMSGNAGMYKILLHGELSYYKAWKFAATLFRRSLGDRPNYWMNHFMLGKCLWKMYSRFWEQNPAVEEGKRPSVDSILRALVRAIETLPKQRDSRQEPILEPHYKLVSVVHKLVLLTAMPFQAGADLIQQQPMAARKGEHVTINTFTEWEAFILESLRHLRDKDKQHWQHRMVNRVATILFDEANPEYEVALSARQEFQKSIFTKTMHIQVWKPDAERPGRHHVYMAKYVRLMIRLLWVCDDKSNMEQLARRVRKKANEFFSFGGEKGVWTECCTAYLKMIRRTGDIPPNIEDIFKATSHEEFDIYSDRLTSWIANPDAHHPALDALREAIELKKINANQMKPAPIDDLINDAWAILYTQVAKNIPGPDPAMFYQGAQNAQSVQHAQTDGPSDGPIRSSLGGMDAMRLNNLVMNMDGTEIPVPLMFAPAEPGRPRKVGISRREVLRRAESAIMRAPELQRAVLPSNPPPPPSSILASNAPSQHSGQHNGASRDDEGEGEGDGDEEMEGTEADEAEESHQGEPDPQGEPQNAGEEMQRVASSEKGSLQDSADDESDLSDVPDMDEEESARIFGIMTSVSTATKAT